jgi:hypothetical protein
LKTFFRTSIAFLFVLIYGLPTWVQLLHHHEEVFLCNAVDEYHFHTQHDSCEICSFHETLFEFELPVFDVETPIYFFQNLVHSLTLSYTIQPQYSFLLRAPPVEMI